MLRKEPAGQECYHHNRLLQLNSDLALPHNFLAGYQPYLAQLVGFFVIEDHVQQNADTLSHSSQVSYVVVLCAWD